MKKLVYYRDDEDSNESDETGCPSYDGDSDSPGLGDGNNGN